MITAIKPVFDRKAKTYKVEAVLDANVLLVHAGFLVFDDHVTTLASVKSGRLVGSWSDRKRAAIIDWLEAEIGNARKG